MTPMIDVVFQLIIFFMLTSHLGDLRRTEVELPNQPGQEQRDDHDAAMIVDIHSDGAYYVSSIEVDLNEIYRLARAGMSMDSDSADFDVLVRPDKNAPAEFLDRLLLRLSQVGVTSWKLGTDGTQSSGVGY